MSHFTPTFKMTTKFSLLPYLVLFSEIRANVAYFTQDINKGAFFLQCSDFKICFEMREV